MNHVESEQPLFRVSFEDNSEFTLPKEWEDVFADYYSPNPSVYPSVAERLRFVTGKYMVNKAWPSKFDGLQFEIEQDNSNQATGDEKYDDPEFYWEKWGSWGAEGKEWGVPRRRIQPPPKWADVAEAVMYFSMRGGLLQKAFQQLGSDTRVIKPEKFIKELEDQQNDYPKTSS